MFVDKPRYWLTGNFNSISYDSWKQWIDNKLFSSILWKHRKIFAWNIKEDTDQILLQLLYMNVDGNIDIRGICIAVKPEDEVYIRKWIDEHTHTIRPSSI